MSYTPLTDITNGNSTPQHPTVKLVTPPDDLDTSHHGPSSTGISLTDGSVKPKYFQNPWKSWRQPSLSDAWTAYSKGAAIALPLHKTARKIKRAVRRDHDSDEEAVSIEEEDEEDEFLDNDKDPRGPDGSIRETKLVPIPSRTYIRPEFSLVHEEDEESDWSDLPLEVVSPQWDNEEKVDVTWLGHASTLVRIPWKRAQGGSRKEGSCGILYDPIFSYRYAVLMLTIWYHAYWLIGARHRSMLDQPDTSILRVLWQIYRLSISAVYRMIIVSYLRHQVQISADDRRSPRLLHHYRSVETSFFDGPLFRRIRFGPMVHFLRYSGRQSDRVGLVA